MEIQKNYIKSLDGVRAIAILLVMAFHFGIIRFGWIGVQLFFVLSGFLIGGILLREKTTTVPLSLRLKNFWIRRSLRIFPLYYVYLLIFIIVYIVYAFPSGYLHDLPYLLTYTFNLTRIDGNWHESAVYTHFWSLCVEEQFYLFFPFVIFCLSVSSLRTLTFIVLIGCPLLRLGFTNYLVQTGKTSFEIFDIIYWFPLSHLDAFFAGTAIPLLQLQHRVKRPQILFAGILLLAASAGLANYLYDSHGHSFPVSIGYNFGDTDTWQQVWYYTILNSLAASLLLVLVSVHNSWLAGSLKKLLECKLLVAIGKVSYGMYIIHWVIQKQLVEKFVQVTDRNKYWLFLLDVPVVFGCALLSYYLLEQRFINLKNRLTNSKVLLKNKNEL
jgi:peptidoglycan/LPS O-acetylase OafA/YrhL